jgi:hypothetical protein
MHEKYNRQGSMCQPDLLLVLTAIRRLIAYIRTVIIIGIINGGRSEYWKLLIWTIFRRPALLMEAITYTVYGYHYRTIYGLRKIQYKIPQNTYTDY